MKTETVFVGQAPSRDSEPGQPFSGRSGEKLAGLLSVTKAEFLAKVRRINLIERYPGKNGKGDAFPVAEARMKALLLQERYMMRPVRFVLVGKNVARAFGIRRPQYFVHGWFYGPFQGMSWTVVPHPSGVSRWWNDAGNRRKAKRFFTKLRRTM